MRKITATCSSLVEFLENVIVVNFVIISHLEKGGFVAGINTGYCFMARKTLLLESEKMSWMINVY